MNKGIFGVDVSVYQGAVDWSRAKAAGVRFVVVKATQGHAYSSASYLFTDRRFAENVDGAHRAGLQVGAYHYLTAMNVDEAKAEAEHFIETIKPYKNKLSLWAAVDVEDVSPARFCGRLRREELSEVVAAFCREVEAAGFRSMLYTNPDYIKNHFADLPDVDIWLALWRDKANVPSGYRRMKLWQWGASAVDGITGEVDSNYGYFELGEDKLAESAQRSPFDEAAPAPIAVPEPSAPLRVGDMVTVRSGARAYDGRRVSRLWYTTPKPVSLIRGDRVVLDARGWCTAFKAEDVARGRDYR